MNRKEWSGIQCCETRAKYWFDVSSTRAAARRRRAAEMSVGEARYVFFDGMNLLWKTPPGGITVTDGSEWMYMLKRSWFPWKNCSHKGAKERFELVRKRNAILGFGSVATPEREIPEAV